MQTSPSPIHGHSVLALVRNSPGFWSDEELKAEANRRFGRDALYYTCSEKDLSLDQLMGFLHSKGKLKRIDGKLWFTGIPCGEGHSH